MTTNPIFVLIASPSREQRTGLVSHLVVNTIHTKYILLALFGLHDGTPPRGVDLGP